MSNLEHRKASCKVHIIDENGTPVINQKITVAQTQHEFLFGCGAFDIMFYMTYAEDEMKKNLEGRIEKWVDLFNFGTIPFYWKFYERTEGEPGAQTMEKPVQFLKDRNIRMKGHPLCWHTLTPKWLLNYDNKTIYDKLMNRIHRDVTQFKGSIDMWDAINEVVIMPIFKQDNGITRVCKDKGRVSMIKEVFAAAKEANPSGIFLLNDFNTSISYEILIDGCLNAGVPIDAIGIQSHQHQGYWGKEKLEETLTRFEQFGLPIHFTENTVISGELMPKEYEDLNDYEVDEWPTNPEGEERQKNELEEMYRVLFDHPLVEAITNWDFVDGAWLDAPSGLLRKDNTAKPSYQMLKNLIKGEWWTNYEVVTDENGYAEIEGFKGSYELVSKGKKATMTLTSGNNKQQIVLK